VATGVPDIHHPALAPDEEAGALKTIGVISSGAQLQSLMLVKITGVERFVYLL
jgi:hypothetical protein